MPPSERAFRERINLRHHPKKGNLSLIPFIKGVFLVAALWFLIIGNVAAPTTPTLAADAAAEAERRELERQLGELEAQIGEYQDQIATYERQGKTLQGEIDRLNAQIAKLNLQVRAINLTLAELAQQIGETENRIGDLELSIEANEKALGKFLRQLYENEDTSIVEIFLKNPSLSDFFDDLNNLSLLQTNLRATITQIKDMRFDLEEKRENLVLARADAETLRQYQETQRQETATIRQEKDQLLVVTRGQESRYQELLQETEKTAAEIRSRLFELLGGGELSFEEAYNLAKLASGATDIRAALILAVLDRESALGRNVGRCGYEDAMHPTRDIPVFMAITGNLGISPDTVMVSCPIVSDGAYGGAMGPAQFIPSTWAIYGGYEKDDQGNWRYDRSKDIIRRVSGASGPSSPWRNADAFVATALYLRDSYNSGSCRSYGEENRHILPQILLQERCAAAKYYAGGRWYTYRFVYGDAVVERANRFENDIRIITS